jgi:O-antigen ligase
MQMIFPLIYWWQKGKGKSIAKALFLTVVAMGAAIVASGSRASAVGFLAGLLVFSLGQARVQKRGLSGLWTAMLILMCTFLVVDLFFPEYLGGLFRTDTTGRTILWKRAWEIFLRSPYVGVGFGGSDKLFLVDAMYLRSIGIFVAGVHSSLMRLLVELGLLGVLLALLGFFVSIRHVWKMLPRFENPKLGVILLATVTAGLANSLFESWLFGFGSSATVPFWLFFAMLCHQADKAVVKVRQAAKEKSQREGTRFRSPITRRAYQFRSRV